MHVLEIGNGIAIQPFLKEADARSSGGAVARAAAQARSSGRYDLVIVDGPPMPWSESGRKVIDLSDGLVAVLPVSVDINDCMEEILEALDGAERKLVGVILNEVGAVGSNQQRRKQYA